MDIKAMAQAQLARIIAAHPSCAVSVEVGGVTVQGIAGTHPDDAVFEQAGIGGQREGVVYIDADAVTITRGTVGVKVDGVPVAVDSARMDPAKALLKVLYTELQ